jgi:hypothetical protein
LDGRMEGREVEWKRIRGMTTSLRQRCQSSDCAWYRACDVLVRHIQRAAHTTTRSSCYSEQYSTSHQTAPPQPP